MNESKLRELLAQVSEGKHTHTFTQLDNNQTEIHEHIEYEHKRGFWGIVTRLLFSTPNLWFMFGYRRWITRRKLARR